MSEKRGSFVGVRQIVAYNWHFYVAAVSFLAVGCVTARFLPQYRPAILLGMALAAFWTASSLLVSAYIYDLSELYRWTWISRVLTRSPRSWFHINAGLDESSGALKQLYPGARSEIVDIFDPVEMTEPSISRARRDSANARRASYSDLGISPRSHDMGFIIFSAHEVRSREGREKLFSEASIALEPGGQLIVVEHLRDSANFLAFGPGFLHFFPRAEWLHAGKAAGLRLEKESKVTPFVSCFVFAKSA